jgi:nicotinamide-nucleotide amidase
MFESQVRPRLRPAREVRTRALHTFGLGESEVAERLGDLMARTRMPVVGTTVASGVVTVRIRSEGLTGEPSPAIDPTEAIIRERLDPYVLGADTDTLAGVVVGLLRARAQTLAVVESCTGGLLGAMITEVAGSSDVFAGGWITYSNQLKMSQVSVPRDTIDRFGAVSRQTAEAMARGGAQRAGTDWAISITGIAGPSGGSADKPVGTVWIALVGPGTADTRQFRFSGERQNIRDWSARTGLAMLRFRLAGREGPPLLRQVE